jgi:hypothetical protein
MISKYKSSYTRATIKSTITPKLLLHALSLIVLTSQLIGLSPVHAQSTADEIMQNADASQYVEVFEGDMPLLFAVGHGGWKQLGSQTNGGYAADPLLRDYFYSILMVRIYERTGHLPYVVYQQGNRNYVNTNRPVGSSQAYYPSNTEAESAYFEFHNQVDHVIAQMENKYGQDWALMINPHTTDLSASTGDRPWDRIADIGFIASVTQLDSDRNSMRALYNRRGETALRGQDSIPYQLFHGQDWPTSDAVWPAAATSNAKTLAKTGDDVWHVLPSWVSGWDTDNWVTAYFNGSSTISYHGTNTLGHHANWANGLDSFQIEFNYTSNSGIGLSRTDPRYANDGSYYQLDVPFITRLMDDFIDAILYSLRVNYNWTPGGAHNIIVDTDDEGFDSTGVWEESCGQGFWDTPSLYSEKEGATATWTPQLLHSGTYQVFVRWTHAESRSDAALYTVNHRNGSQNFSIDQSGGQDAKWVSLGQFEFNAGASGNVTLESSGAGSVAADAVLFRLVSSANEVIVDNLDPEFTTTGAWVESEAGSEYAGSSVYAMSDGATATWTPDLLDAGTYFVYGCWSFFSTRAQSAPYTVAHADGSSTVRVNQRQHAGHWVLLGVYPFHAGTTGNVTLVREEGDGTSTCADAVRFVRVGAFNMNNLYLPAVLSQ